MYMMTIKPGMKTRKKAAFRVHVSCNIAELPAFWSPFSKETVCEKFQIAREKVVMTVTTTFKSGGDMSLIYDVTLLLTFFVEYLTEVNKFNVTRFFNK